MYCMYKNIFYNIKHTVFSDMLTRRSGARATRSLHSSLVWRVPFLTASTPHFKFGGLPSKIVLIFLYFFTFTSANAVSVNEVHVRSFFILCMNSTYFQFYLKDVLWPKSDILTTSYVLYDAHWQERLCLFSLRKKIACI